MNSVPFEFFYYLLLSARFDVGSVFRNIRHTEMRIFVNFGLDLHFQGYLLYTLDGLTQCDDFGENLMELD